MSGQSKGTQRVAWLVAIGALLLFFAANEAMAQDNRLALLVGHQRGWQKDPPLRYALSGDLRPMASTLQRIGFQVKTLENKGPDALRKALAWLRQRVQQKPKITTFLFYYSGHSDRRFLHLGPKRKGKPIAYQELVQAFKKLPVARRLVILDSCFSGEIIRKFGSLKRYRHLVPKGARARRWVDLSRSFIPRNDERSLQVISSGLAISWESRRYKASIFTHHLLRGLRGSADRDHNGKISTFELFDFVSDAMRRDIQEKPKMFGVFQRSQSYALAPAYNSHLWIGPKVEGQLRVSVSNFYWSWNKRNKRPVRLALVHGKGVVELRKGSRCWRQKILLPKGRVARLQGQWKTMRCQRDARRAKGSVQLQTRIDMPPPSPWRLALRLGTLSSALGSDTPFLGGEFGLRRRFFGIYLGAWGTSQQRLTTRSEQLLLNLRVEAGYRHRWAWFSLFAGGYVTAGLAIQDLGQSNAAGALFRYGLVVSPTFWLSPRWALGIHGRVGFELASLGSRLVHQPTFAAMLGLQYAF